MIRQGDVLIKPVAMIPAGLAEVPREDGRLILAHGEVTGHAHVVQSQEVRMFGSLTGDDGPRYIEVPNPCNVVHDEHAPLGLDAGFYEVRRQREYSPEEIRRVAD